MDSTVPRLRERWDEALATLRSAGDNPAAYALHAELGAHLRRSLDLALASTEDGPFKDVLTAASTQLSSYLETRRRAIN